MSSPLPDVSQPRSGLQVSIQPSSPATVSLANQSWGRVHSIYSAVSGRTHKLCLEVCSENRCVHTKPLRLGPPFKSIQYPLASLPMTAPPSMLRAHPIHAVSQPHPNSLPACHCENKPQSTDPPSPFLSNPIHKLVRLPLYARMLTPRVRTHVPSPAPTACLRPLQSCGFWGLS